ncbi:MAG: DUF3341 domain-containing protein [Vicingaceae bacterium]
MAGKVLYATYDDDHKLIEGAKELVGKGVYINTVYSPFPIHGIDPIIGIKRTRLAICAFIYGLTGLLLALLGFWYFMISDWPMIIGGKPNQTLFQNLPAFIPVTFEFTVLCAGHGMAITYLLRNWTLPFVQARNPYPYTTDDKFVMEIYPDYEHTKEDELKKMIESTGSILIEEK